MPPFTPFPLTPSELVYLNGEKYSPKKALINNSKLMHTDQSVATNELINAMLCIAFLASEQEGAILLAVRTEKRLLGSREALYADPGQVNRIWPVPSIESLVCDNSRALYSNNKNLVRAIVYNLLDSDTVAPGSAIIELLKPYLAKRALLTTGEKKVLGFIPSVTYQLPQSTIDGAAQFPMERINNLITNTSRSRPQIWKLLIAGIKAGIAERVEQSNDD
ncbi:MAG: hypothetical protein ACYCZF_09290 [Anaerolineae bacterium]